MIWNRKSAREKPAVLQPSVPASDPASQRTVSGLGTQIAAETRGATPVRVSVRPDATPLKLTSSFQDAALHLADGRVLVGRARIEGDRIRIAEFESRLQSLVPRADLTRFESVNDYLVDQFHSLDQRLAQAGFPAATPFWDDAVTAWLRSTATWFVARVGRRGGKGVTACKLATLFAKYCPLVGLPPGERAFIQFLSVDRDEAAGRLRMVEAMLDAEAVRYARRGDEIELLERPVTIRVTTASVRGTVGRTTILAIEDEVARWRDSESGANPASEVHASVGPSMASQPFARGMVLSAPFAENDFHAQLFDRGNTETQRVFYAPTWIANPTISEARTRQLEPDPRVHAREYLAQPIASITSICGREELASVTSARVFNRPRVDGGRHGATMDPGFKVDSFVLSIWHRELRQGPNGAILDVIVQDAILHIRPTFLRKVSLDDAIRQVVEVCRAYGITSIDSDGHYSEAIGPKLAEHAIRLEVRDQTSKAITARVENLQARIHTGAIVLLDHAEQTTEILAAQLVAHAGGRLTLKAPERRGAHDDLVSAILLACDVESVAKLPPCAGEIVVEYDPLFFHHDTKSFDGGRAHYFKRSGDRLLPAEPPYGSMAFIRWAQDLWSQGGSTESINRWIVELGLEPKPGLDPALLDPENHTGGIAVRVHT